MLYFIFNCRDKLYEPRTWSICRFSFHYFSQLVQSCGFSTAYCLKITISRYVHTSMQYYMHVHNFVQHSFHVFMYSLLSMQIPNVLGFIFGLLQMALYARYRKADETLVQKLPETQKQFAVVEEDKSPNHKIIEIVKLSSFLNSESQQQNLAKGTQA